jgi:serine/threonine protein kinase
MVLPASIAHYNILERIGEGGVGEVYRARDTKVGRTVALKVVSPAIASDAARLDRLLERARETSVLSHPNIAALWDFGEAEGYHYLAYEFAAGQRLRDDAAGAAMNPKRALDLAIQIADGVADAHAHGIIHGDLRPETVVVTAKGSAKILDFGLAPWTRGGATRALAAQTPDALPAESVPVVSCMSPEQVVGGAVDARTDVFSLGTLTYELATGRNPFAGPTAADTVVNVLRTAPVPPSQMNPAMPVDLDAVLGRALAQDLARRQQTVAAFAAELRSVAVKLYARGNDDSARASSAVLHLDESPDKRASSLLFGALTLAAVAAFAVWWWLMRG